VPVPKQHIVKYAPNTRTCGSLSDREATSGHEQIEGWNKFTHTMRALSVILRAHPRIELGISRELVCKLIAQVHELMLRPIKRSKKAQEAGHRSEAK